MQCDHIINGRATESALGPYMECWCIKDNCIIGFTFGLDAKKQITITVFLNDVLIDKLYTDIPYEDVVNVIDRLAYIPFSNWVSILKSYNKNKELVNETLGSDKQL